MCSLAKFPSKSQLVSGSQWTACLREPLFPSVHKALLMGVHTKTLSVHLYTYTYCSCDDEIAKRFPWFGRKTVHHSQEYIEPEKLRHLLAMFLPDRVILTVEYFGSAMKA